MTGPRFLRWSATATLRRPSRNIYRDSESRAGGRCQRGLRLGRRGLESLQIAPAAVSDEIAGTADDVVRQAADSALRLLGERRRIQETHTALNSTTIPGFLT